MTELRWPLTSKPGFLIVQGQEWRILWVKTLHPIMSIPETSIRPTSPLPPKPEAKSRPPVPRKPSAQGDSPPLGDGDSTVEASCGKVKRIVDRFSQREASLKAAGKSNSTSGLTSSKGSKRAPTIKPKPARASVQIQQGGDQAPPLPLKRSRILRQQRDQAKTETLGGEEGNGVCVEGGRSGRVYEITHLINQMFFRKCIS